MDLTPSTNNGLAGSQGRPFDCFGQIRISFCPMLVTGIKISLPRPAPIAECEGDWLGIAARLWAIFARCLYWLSSWSSKVFASQLERIFIVPSSENRFFIGAGLRWRLNWLLSWFLKIFSKKGFEVAITQPSASASPRQVFRGTLVTTLIERAIAIPVLKRAINEKLGAKVLETNWGYFTTNVSFTLDPFPLLQSIPLGIGNDITLAEWSTNHESLTFTITYYNSGSYRPTAPSNPGG